MAAIRLAELDPASLPAGRHSLRAEVARAGSEVVQADVRVLRGATGPTLLAIGAVHGDEYEGPAALARLLATVDPAALRGTLVALPVVNEPAFFATSRSGPDGLNLARVFPGRGDGAVTEQIAASVTALMARADALVDLHAAGTFYTLHPWAGYGLHPEPTVLATQRKLATAFGLDFVWGTGLAPGRSLSAAAALMVPAIYVEMTGSGLCRPADVAANVRGMTQVLRAMEMLDGPYPTARPVWFREADGGEEGHLQVDHPSPRRGVFEPAVALWDEVEAGMPIGAVNTPGGDEGVTIPALRAGRVAMLRTAPPVQPGDYLAVVVPV